MSQERIRNDDGDDQIAQHWPRAEVAWDPQVSAVDLSGNVTHIPLAAFDGRHNIMEQIRAQQQQQLNNGSEGSLSLEYVTTLDHRSSSSYNNSVGSDNNDDSVGSNNNTINVNELEEVALAEGNEEEEEKEEEEEENPWREEDDDDTYHPDSHQPQQRERAGHRGGPRHRLSRAQR